MMRNQPRHEPLWPPRYKIFTCKNTHKSTSRTEKGFHGKIGCFMYPNWTPEGSLSKRATCKKAKANHYSRIRLTNKAEEHTKVPTQNEKTV
jgi:hypothetical protein